MATPRKRSSPAAMTLRRAIQDLGERTPVSSPFHRHPPTLLASLFEEWRTLGERIERFPEPLPPADLARYAFTGYLLYDGMERPAEALAWYRRQFELAPGKKPWDRHQGLLHLFLLAAFTVNDVDLAAHYLTEMVTVTELKRSDLRARRDLVIEFLASHPDTALPESMRASLEVVLGPAASPLPSPLNGRRALEAYGLA